MLIFQKNAIQQSVRITAVVVFSLASANAQQPQQAIAFGKSPATRTLDAANQVSPAESRLPGIRFIQSRPILRAGGLPIGVPCGHHTRRRLR